MALPMPAADASPTERGDYWLSVAEDDYQSRRFDAATAAAHMATSHYQRADLTPTDLHVDALGLQGPTGAELAKRAQELEHGGRGVGQ